MTPIANCACATLIAFSAIIVGHYDKMGEVKQPLPQPTSTQTGKVIDLEQALKINQMKGALFIDLREPLTDSSSRVTGSIRLTGAQILNIKDHPEEQERIRTASVIVLYCEEFCLTAVRYQIELSRYNRSVFIYSGGFTQWRSLGLPTERY